MTKPFQNCLNCAKPLIATILFDQWGRTIDEIYYINDNIFCKDCFSNYVYNFGERKGLSKDDIYFVIKEQKFYSDMK